jgi:hypothetical protein
MVEGDFIDLNEKYNKQFLSKKFHRITQINIQNLFSGFKDTPDQFFLRFYLKLSESPTLLLHFSSTSVKLPYKVTLQK